MKSPGQIKATQN